MKIVTSVTNTKPETVVGLQNLTPGFWRDIEEGTIIHAFKSLIPPHQMQFIIVNQNEGRFSMPVTDFMECPNEVWDTADWSEAEFEKIRSGSFTVSW